MTEFEDTLDDDIYLKKSLDLLYYNNKMAKMGTIKNTP